MAVTTTTSSKTINLISCDGKCFEVPVHQALRSETIKNLLDMAEDLEEIDLPSITGDVLAKVIEYLAFYEAKKNAGLIQGTRVELFDWELEFFQGDMDPDSLETHPRLVSSSKKNEDGEGVVRELQTEDLNGEQFVCQVLVAADYLALEHLIKMISKRLAILAKKKYPTRQELLKHLFGIEHDGTAECEQMLLKKYSWLLPEDKSK